jgi:hypothetical protein
MNDTEMVKNYYNSIVSHEWERMMRHPFEFEITKRFMNRYIKPGERVLDKFS